MKPFSAKSLLSAYKQYQRTRVCLLFGTGISICMLACSLLNQSIQIATIGALLFAIVQLIENIKIAKYFCAVTIYLYSNSEEYKHHTFNN